jgi:hypothetical protein
MTNLSVNASASPAFTTLVRGMVTEETQTRGTVPEFIAECLIGHTHREYDLEAKELFLLGSIVGRRLDLPGKILLLTCLFAPWAGRPKLTPSREHDR